MEVLYAVPSASTPFGAVLSPFRWGGACAITPLIDRQSKKAKASARKKQAEAEEAKAAEQTQVEVAGSSGRGTETGEVHVYTGRARRASRRATGVG